MPDLSKLAKVPEGGDELVTAVMETTDMDNLTMVKKINARLAA